MNLSIILKSKIMILIFIYVLFSYGYVWGGDYRKDDMDIWDWLLYAIAPIYAPFLLGLMICKKLEEDHL